MRWVTCTARKHISHGKGPSWRFRSKMLFDPQKATNCRKLQTRVWATHKKPKFPTASNVPLLGKTPFKFISIFFHLHSLFPPSPHHSEFLFWLWSTTHLWANNFQKRSYYSQHLNFQYLNRFNFSYKFNLTDKFWGLRGDDELRIDCANYSTKWVP